MKKLISDLKPVNIFNASTFADKLLFILLVVFAVTGFFYLKELFPAGNHVKISVDNKTVYTLPLDENRIVAVTGSSEDNLVIEIKDGKVRIKEASRPKKACMNRGWVDRGTIVCLPNKVVVSVSENGRHSVGSEYDGVTK